MVSYGIEPVIEGLEAKFTTYNLTHPVVVNNFRDYQRRVFPFLGVDRICILPSDTLDGLAIVYKERIRNKPEFYYYLENLTPRLYSIKFIDLIIRKINDSRKYIENTRKSYKHFMDQKKWINKQKKKTQ